MAHTARPEPTASVDTSGLRALAEERHAKQRAVSATRRLAAACHASGLEAVEMDDTTRTQMIAELEALRAQVRAAGAGGGTPDDALIASVDELDALVRTKQASGEAHSLARELEQRLIAWEAEHPKLVALASRVAHALENSGL